MNVIVSEVKGNGQLLDGGSMFGNAPRAVWEKWIPPDSLGRIPLACRALLLEYADKRVLFETGIGCFFPEKLAQRFGVQNHKTHCLLENLKKLNADQADIDYVVLSHLHFDHAGGLLTAYEENKNFGLCFPKAKYLVGKKAYERAKNPHPRDRASFIPELMPLLEDSGRLQIIEGTDFPDPSLPISFEYSDGHTPGQMLSVIHGKNNKLIFTGDLVPGSHWVHLPISMGYDRFPEMLIDEKKDLYEKYPEGLLFFTHDNLIAMGQLEKDDSGRFTLNQKYVELEREEI